MQIKQIIHAIIEPTRPARASIGTTDQLNRDPDAVTRPLYRAFQQVFGAELFCDLRYRQILAAQHKRRLPRDDIEIPAPTKRSGDLFNDPIGKHVCLACTNLLERQNCQSWPLISPYRQWRNRGHVRLSAFTQPVFEPFRSEIETFQKSFGAPSNLELFYVHPDAMAVSLYCFPERFSKH
ncbi:MAG: hypothetical protein GYB27_26250 [Rhodobacteraceae bacterium]|nr:hypothetical protein [Paracoccaceae bacterium]